MLDSSRELLGVQDATIDNKGRLAIPAKFREILRAYDSPVLYTTLKSRTHLLLYPEQNWRTVVEEELPKMNGNPTLRAIGQLMQSHMEKLTPDSAGRILLPPRLRSLMEFAEDKDVVVAGRTDRLEMWSRTRWDEQTGAILDMDPAALEAELAKNNVRI
ncbi:MAG: cell division/cell wall cluster transcriptional repressor MraZ [Neisseria sp.]|nr:cell division/cell wall cluster transcriptional repressor MraZ [Neisseria sp.]